jgi:hypothetical protein
MEQLANEARLHKVMPLQVFRVSKGNLFGEQGRNGRLEANIIGIPCIIVKSTAGQFTLRPSQAFLAFAEWSWASSISPCNSTKVGRHSKRR